MKVNITYYDCESLTIEEVVARAVQNYGSGAKVETGPDSSIAYDHIYHGFMQLITHRQISALYDKSSDYATELKRLRQEVLVKVEEILDQVIIENEAKVH
jgi:hypothetical protein